MAFYSKSLSLVEQNYEIHNKEMLTIIRALEEWRHFLEGARHPVEIWTDHKNLEYFMMAKKLNHRQAQWSLYLACFDFKLVHRPGRSMGKPDALSRRLVMGINRFDHETKVNARSERRNLQAASQLCTKQVGTGEINQIIESLLKVKVQRITKTY